MCELRTPKLVIVCAGLIFFTMYTFHRIRTEIFDFVDLPVLLETPQLVNDQRSEVKYILFWTPMLSSKTWHFLTTGKDLFKHCTFTNCYVTTDRNLIPIENYSAILFYTPKSPFYPNDLPERRSRHQRYVFSNRETPVIFSKLGNGYLLKNFFNWTMTYRFDSDIPRRHGRLVISETEYQLPTEDFVRNKTRTLAWFVSKCQTPSKRSKIAEKLQLYLDLDIYGQCGPRKCNVQRKEKCYEMLERNYKFYLSFENSICKDYTTEKLYNVLKRNVIPVVYGGGDYNAILPPHSVINVLDFESVEKLAQFLKEVASNSTRYLEYFEWKKRMKVVTDEEETVCKLCEMLNDANQPEKIYEDIGYWWFSKEKSECKIGKDLPKILKA